MLVRIAILAWPIFFSIYGAYSAFMSLGKKTFYWILGASALVSILIIKYGGEKNADRFI